MLAHLLPLDGAASQRAPRLEVTPIDEMEIKVDSTHLRGDSASYVGRELAAAASPAERTRLVRAILAVIGFSSFACITLDMNNATPVRAFLLKTYAGSQFPARYFHDGLHRVDPRIASALDSCQPYVWDLRSLTGTAHHHGRLAAIRELLVGMDRDEVRSGVMFGLPLAGNLRWILSFACSGTDREHISDSIVGQALMLGLAVHRYTADHVARLAKPAESKAISHVQRSILQCVASGMSDKEISVRLKMSTYNVDYHLRSLRREYQANNRSQLAYMAGRFDLV